MSFSILTVFLALRSVAAVPSFHGRDKAAQGISCPTADSTTYASGTKNFKIECGIDHLAGDMPSPNGQKAANLEACIQQCVDREGCTAVAFADKWACYLKSTVGASTPKSNVWGALLVAASASPSPAVAPSPAAQSPVPSAPAASAPAASAPAASVTATSIPDPVETGQVASPIANFKPTTTVPARSSGTPAAESGGGSTGGSCARPKPKSSSSKRGVSYNDPKVISSFGSAVTWAYNWGSTPGGSIPSGVTYIPMLWSSKSAGNWDKDAKAGIAAGADTLLSFNEPDLASQSNLDVTTAVAGYKQYMNPLACDARLAGPAVTNGPAPMGLTYLANFVSACTGCIIDVIPIHWYDSATNIDYFKSYIGEAYKAGGNRPLWITEFGASGTDDQIVAFFNTVLPWLDSLDYVERYAYFMASPGLLVSSSGSGLSTIGAKYVA